MRRQPQLFLVPTSTGSFAYQCQDDEHILGSENLDEAHTRYQSEDKGDGCNEEGNNDTRNDGGGFRLRNHTGDAIVFTTWFITQLPT